MTESMLGETGLNVGESNLASQPAQPPKCPMCQGLKIWKDGIRSTKNGDVQRYLCRSCGYRFSQPGEKFSVQSQTRTFQPRPNLAKPPIRNGNLPSKKSLNDLPLSLSEDIGSHNATVVGKALNNLRSLNSEHRVCVTETKVAKNLETQRKTHQKRSVGDTKKNLEDQRGKIVDFTWWMKKEGYRSITIKTYAHDLKTLHNKGADLLNSESVKEIIANQETWSEAYKHKLCGVYTVFLNMQGQTWAQPKYKSIERIPFIPTEKEIDMLIAGCGKKTAVYLQLLKETGMRSGEADNLKWIDIDFERGTIRVTPEKHSKPRILRLSKKCLVMLKHLKKTSDKMFGNVALNTRRSNFAHSRKLLARKLNNPRLRQIHFHTLRHWKATMLYHQTKDILYVKEFLGHRNINSTLIYIQLEQALFDKDADSFTCRVAKTPEEMKQLIEAGFDFVTEKDNLIYFRKRK